MVKQMTAGGCKWSEHEWRTKHYANGTGRQVMMCDKCLKHLTIAKIEATNRMMTAKRIAAYRNAE